MDLIEKEDSLSSSLEIRLSFCNYFDDIFFFCEYCRKVIKIRFKRIRNHTSQRGFPTTRRSPEENRWESSSFDEFPDSLSFTDEMRLPDKIIEFFWSEEWGERSDGVFEDGLHPTIVGILWKKKSSIFCVTMKDVIQFFTRISLKWFFYAHIIFSLHYSGYQSYRDYFMMYMFHNFTKVTKAK